MTRSPEMTVSSIYCTSISMMPALILPGQATAPRAATLWTSSRAGTRTRARRRVRRSTIRQRSARPGGRWWRSAPADDVAGPAGQDQGIQAPRPDRLVARERPQPGAQVARLAHPAERAPPLAGLRPEQIPQLRRSPPRSRAHPDPPDSAPRLATISLMIGEISSRIHCIMVARRHVGGRLCFFCAPPPSLRVRRTRALCR